MKGLRATAIAVFLLVGSCAGEPVKEERSKPLVMPATWSMADVPRVTGPGRFDKLLVHLQHGSKQDCSKIFVAFQAYMDVCLPLVIEHLEDMGEFGAASFPIVNRQGAPVRQVEILPKTYNVGAALELLLISYFYRDAPRTTFNKDNRKGAKQLWKKWYAERARLFHWNQQGFYSAR